MKRNALAVALSTLCFLSAGCEAKRVAESIKPPPERLVCEAAPRSRPTVPPEYVIDWTKVLVPGNAQATLDNAKREHERYVATVRTREGLVVGYLVVVEGRLFACSDNMAWLRTFFAAQPGEAVGAP